METQTYQLELSFREKVSGKWSKGDFAKNHLSYYLSERIPKLLIKWDKHKDKQILYLKRNWELLEVFKRYRMRIPSYIASAMVILTSFVLQSKGLVSETPVLIGVTSIIFLMGILGCIMNYWIRKQYTYTTKKIDYLYLRLNMKSDNFLSPKEEQKEMYEKYEVADRMFYTGFILIGFTWFICTLGLVWPFI